MKVYIYVFLISFFVTLFVTPIVRRIANRLRFLDYPGYRKIHETGMPLMGGVAVFVGFLGGLSYYGFEKDISIIVLGGLVMLLLGLIDDQVHLGARMKFVLPSIATLIMIFLGIKTTFLPMVPYDLLNITFTFIWFICVVNAFNFIDNMDGLATGVGIISAISFAIISFFSSKTIPLIIALSLAGACMGFLKYNFKPASIFLGDGGSMFIGFVLGSLAIYGTWISLTFTNSLLIPVFILGYPIYDACFVSILRLLNKKKPWIGDKNHTSHRIGALIKKQRLTVILLYLLAITLSTIPLLLLRINLRLTFLVLVITSLFLFILSVILSTVPFHEKNICKEKIIKID